MCGRFENKLTDDLILKLFEELKALLVLDESLKKRKSEDIAPTEKIVAIRNINEQYNLSLFNWGIKFKPDSPLIFNSRIETIKEKKYWFSLFDKNRCIVPMTGFYEWKTEGKRKTKYRISIPSYKLFFVPSLFFKDKEDNIFVSLITTSPNKFIQNIHHRMPVILDTKNALTYLTNDAKDNLELCVPLSDNINMEMNPA